MQYINVKPLALLYLIFACHRAVCLNSNLKDGKDVSATLAHYTMSNCRKKEAI